MQNCIEAVPGIGWSTISKIGNAIPDPEPQGIMRIIKKSENERKEDIRATKRLTTSNHSESKQE
jgi:hypothetical protein